MALWPSGTGTISCVLDADNLLGGVLVVSPDLNLYKLLQRVEYLKNHGSVGNRDKTIYQLIVPIKELCERYVAGYPDYRSFAFEWPWVRTFIPLQARLCVEQLLWSKGWPWRSLITGFKPVDMGGSGESPEGDSSSGVPGRGAKGSYPISAQRTQRTQVKTRRHRR